MTFGKLEYSIAMFLVVLFDLIYATAFNKFTFTIGIAIGFLIGMWLGTLLAWVMLK